MCDTKGALLGVTTCLLKIWDANILTIGFESASQISLLLKEESKFYKSLAA